MKTVYKSPEGKKIIMDRYEEILNLWPAPFKMHIIPTEYGDTFVISSGSDTGKPVVLLHGSATNSAMWMGDAAILGKTHKVYAVDIIGEPGKSAESRPKMETCTYASWLLQVLDGLGIKKASIVGNSLGGWMAVDFATCYPDKVESLVLLAPGGICPIHTSFVPKAVGLMFLGKKGTEKLNKILFGDTKIPEEALAFGRLISKHYIPRPFKAPVFSDEALAKLTMPVLYVGGDKDALFRSRQCASKLKTIAPSADTRVLAGVHHTLINMADDIATFIDKKES